MTKFELGRWLERVGHEWYINPDYYTKSELIELVELRFDAMQKK